VTLNGGSRKPKKLLYMALLLSEDLARDTDNYQGKNFKYQDVRVN
jgi:hypothetical protein